MGWSFLDFTGLSRFFGKLPEKLVTTDTTQTIPGTKSFSSTILGSVSGSAASAAKDGAGNVIADTYETKEDAATHLTKSDAAGTYLSKTDAASAYVQTAAVDQTIAGTKTFLKPIPGSVTGSSGSCTGNAASATKLATARTINGTSFNGTANITTANWGTARNIAIADATATNTGEAVSVNGSAAVTLKLPAAIKANVTGSVTGNAATATKLATARTIALSGAATGTATSFDGSGNITIPVTSLDASKLTGTASVSTTGNAATATKLAAKRTIALSGAATGTATSFDGSGNITIPVTSLDASKLTGTASVSTTGNAATATKLAAKRTIALSGAATGTATGFDGSGNITIPVTALASSAIRAQWYAAYPDGAEAHNAMWGGRDITTAFNNGTVSTNIANGTFKDIFPGDYITKQVTISGTAYTVNWVIADCDYWINKGDTAMTAHHVVIVPQAPIFSVNMNNDNVTTGGYAGSRMYKETIPACATGIVNAFGSSHILTFRDSITRAVNTSSISSGAPFWTGASSDWGWYDAQCNLMCERMVYGMPAFSSSAWDAGVATRQMSAFRLSERLINYNRGWWWLRDVVSSAFFAAVGGFGSAGAHHASNVRGVRPFALLR